MFTYISPQTIQFWIGFNMFILRLAEARCFECLRMDSFSESDVASFGSAARAMDSRCLQTWVVKTLWLVPGLVRQRGHFWSSIGWALVLFAAANAYRASTSMSEFLWCKSIWSFQSSGLADSALHKGHVQLTSILCWENSCSCQSLPKTWRSRN
jgi:hypothetical protein